MTDESGGMLEVLRQFGDHLQIAIVIGSVPTDGSGNIVVQYANTSAAILFGYPSGLILQGVNIKTLMPPDARKDHDQHVNNHLAGNDEPRPSVMGSWRKLCAMRKDGSHVPVFFNVARIETPHEKYFVSFFLDRTDDVEQEQALADALALANSAREEAEAMRETAEKARIEAEDGMLRQKRLVGQMTLLRQVFSATVGLVVMLGALVMVQWSLGGEVEGLSMVKDVLLVLTGILGSAMASVFDSRNSDS